MRVVYATNSLAEVPLSLIRWCRQNYLDLFISRSLDELSLTVQKFDKNDLLIADRLPFIIPRLLLEQSRFLCVNVHPALLPKHKGSYSLFWSALLHEECGVSVHEITHEVDSGNLFLQERIKFDSLITFRELYAEVRLQTELLILTFLREYFEGKTTQTKQGESVTPVHTKNSTLPLLAKLPLGWDTRIKDAREILESELRTLDWVTSLRHQSS